MGLCRFDMLPCLRDGGKLSFCEVVDLDGRGLVVRSAMRALSSSCKSTSPDVGGLKIRDRFGGQPRIIFLYHSICLNLAKTGREASIAMIIGALKSADSIAPADSPQARNVIMSQVMQR